MKKIAALTFDDGPSEHTLRILDALEKHCARATFFVMGNKIEAEKRTIQRAFNMGNEIITHAWNHRNLTTLTADEIKAELNETSALIESVTGVYPTFYRPPYGAVNDTVKKVSAEQGYAIINWSVDPLDWECKNAELVYERIMANMHDRAIILSHDVYDSTAEAMERVIPELICRGYEIVTVSELMCRSGITLEAGAVYDNG
ncbi:MAG: polysaccharide deacetylase family protein [Oscillospiraceae bacterium]|nr:polysaccharide deacetylase family protein [Oscillospiraceae bacterium]